MRLKWKWPWKAAHIGPPDETTQDRIQMIADQRQKLRHAQRFVTDLKAHDAINHYAQRIRRSAAIVAEQEGSR